MRVPKRDGSDLTSARNGSCALVSLLPYPPVCPGNGLEGSGSPGNRRIPRRNLLSVTRRESRAQSAAGSCRPTSLSRLDKRRRTRVHMLELVQSLRSSGGEPREDDVDDETTFHILGPRERDGRRADASPGIFLDFTDVGEIGAVLSWAATAGLEGAHTIRGLRNGFHLGNVFRGGLGFTGLPSRR